MTDYKLCDGLSATELVCRCGTCEYSDPAIIKYVVKPELIEKYYELRKFLGIPIGISRGVSCEEHHKNIYKKRYGDKWEKHYTPNSAHLCINGFFSGIDTYPLMNDFIFYEKAAIYFRFSGVIRYMKNIGGIYVSRFVHLDVMHRPKHPHVYWPSEPSYYSD